MIGPIQSTSGSLLLSTELEINHNAVTTTNSSCSAEQKPQKESENISALLQMVNSSDVNLNNKNILNKISTTVCKSSQER